MKTTAFPFLTASSRFSAIPFRPDTKQDRHAAREAMTVPAAGGRIRLPKDKVIRLERRSRISGLSVERGTVWITESPAKGDLLVQEGSDVRLRGGWPVVLQALTEVTLVFGREGEL